MQFLDSLQHHIDQDLDEESSFFNKESCLSNINDSYQVLLIGLIRNYIGIRVNYYPNWTIRRLFLYGKVRLHQYNSIFSTVLVVKKSPVPLP